MSRTPQPTMGTGPVDAVRHFIIHYQFDLVILISLTIAAARMIAPLGQNLDLQLNDESVYLHNGAALLTQGFPAPDWAPLYAMWYFALHLLQPDRVALYFLSYGLLSALMPLGLYAVLRAYRVSPLAAGITAFVVMSAPANLLVWPRVSHFALLVIFTALIIAARMRSTARALTVSGLFAFVAAYVRPELAFVSMLSFAGVGISLLRRTPAQRRLDRRWLLVALTICVCFCMVWGIPTGIGYRSFDAFSQHFALNWVEWTESDLSPWSDAPQIMAANFGSVDSIWNALQSNPLAFAVHMGRNIQRVPQVLSDLFLDHQQLLGSDTWQPVEVTGFVALFGGLLAWRLVQPARFPPLSSAALWISFCYLVVISGITFLMYPRGHYVIILGMMLLFSLVVSLHPNEAQRAPWHIGLVLSFAILGVIVVPTADRMFPASPQRPTLATITFLQQLPLKGPINMLEAEGGFNIYLTADVQRVAEYTKQVGFNQFLTDRQINMIVVTERLREYSRFRSDPEWQAFLRDSASFGFQKMDVPGTDYVVLISNEVLSAAP